MPNNFIVMGDVDSEEVQQQEAFRRGGSFAACLHFCPSQAVQYGKATVKKGRYETSKGKAPH